MEQLLVIIPIIVVLGVIAHLTDDDENSSRGEEDA